MLWFQLSYATSVTCTGDRTPIYCLGGSCAVHCTMRAVGVGVTRTLSSGFGIRSRDLPLHQVCVLTPGIEPGGARWERARLAITSLVTDCKRKADRGGARTLNLLVRSQVLYIPVELRDQMNCPCQESNLDRKVRSLACYPLQITRAVWRRSVSIALSQHMRPGSGPSRCANRRYPRRGSDSLPPLIRGRAATSCLRKSTTAGFEPAHP